MRLKRLFIKLAAELSTRAADRKERLRLEQEAREAREEEKRLK